MTTELLIVGLSFQTLAFVVAAATIGRLRRRLAETQRWLRDEIEAHDKTRGCLRDAAARMRRHNRERVLGIIEAQRSD